MKKVLLFTLLLFSGLTASQVFPSLIGESYELIKHFSDFIMFTALSYIMINVGTEFEIEKTKIKSYGTDYLVAMATAAVPWIFVTLYFLLILPHGSFDSWGAWKETLLLGRFAAPTSAGILFAMLAAAGLKHTWLFGKARILAIFDDLDTILLMIPLQIIMIGFHMELMSILLIITMLLLVAWAKMNSINLPHKWYHFVIYSFIITTVCELASKFLSKTDVPIHIEVLLPAFVLGVVIKASHQNSNPSKDRASDIISYLFMFLVGLSTPLFLGVDFEKVAADAVTITGSQPMMGWEVIAIHVLIITLLSNIGKMFPMLFYRDRPLKERLALSIGMFARGEVGAGIIMIAIGYHLGGPLMIIALLSLALNLLLTGLFIVIVKQLLKSVYKGKEKEINDVDTAV
jgi:Kef-type K+ transport systems, membrane components